MAKVIQFKGSNPVVEMGNVEFTAYGYDELVSMRDLDSVQNYRVPVNALPDYDKIIPCVIADWRRTALNLAIANARIKQLKQQIKDK